MKTCSLLLLGCLSIQSATVRIEDTDQPESKAAPQGSVHIATTSFIVDATEFTKIVPFFELKGELTGDADVKTLQTVTLLDERGVEIIHPVKLRPDRTFLFLSAWAAPIGGRAKFTVAINTATNNAAYFGTRVGIKVLSLRTMNDSVTGPFPISGAEHTIDASDAPENCFVSLGERDPKTKRYDVPLNSEQVLASLTIQAPQSDDVECSYIRFLVTGNSQSIEGIGVRIGERMFPSRWTGKYWVSEISTVIPSGTLEEFDIVGTFKASGKITVRMDTATDIKTLSLSSGYGIWPVASGPVSSTVSDDTEFTRSPWFDGSLLDTEGIPVIEIRLTEVHVVKKDGETFLWIKGRADKSKLYLLMVSKDLQKWGIHGAFQPTHDEFSEYAGGFYGDYEDRAFFKLVPFQ